MRTCTGSACGAGESGWRDGDLAVGLIDGPHELLDDEVADVGAIGLDIAVGGRLVVLADAALVNVFDPPVLESRDVDLFSFR